MKNIKKSGFTLVELSIVLVIIGLIVGGVVGGQSLIKSSKMNKVVSQLNSYQVAVRTFDLQYDALPGDFSEAWNYWGTDCASTDVRCNGDGDNSLESNNGATGSGYFQERLMFWKHLALAGLTTDISLTGAQDNSGAPGYASAGVNVPAGIINSSIIIAQNGGYNDRDAVYGRYGNVIILASVPAAENYGGGGALAPIDAKALDKKMDDGVASNGDLRTTSSTGNHDVFDCVGDGNVSSIAPATYNLSSTFTSCRMAYYID